MGQQELGLQFQTTNSQLTIYPEIITPELAKRLLLTNHKNNRKLKPTVVQSYKRQMEKGLWRTNTGEGIKISENNLLINGQHRLQAIIEYGKPVEMLIFAGIPEDSMTCIDDGVKRTLTDAMVINGKNVPNQAAVNNSLICLMTLHTCGYISKHYESITGARRNSTSELIQFYDLIPNYTESCADFFSKFKYTKVGKIMPLGSAIALWYLFKDLNEEVVYSIFKSYETGIPMDNLREKSPIYHACERSRRSRELKIRVRPWEHIMTFLWVLEKSLTKTEVMMLPKMEWNWAENNPLVFHARKKLLGIVI